MFLPGWPDVWQDLHLPGQHVLHADTPAQILAPGLRMARRDGLLRQSRDGNPGTVPRLSQNDR